MSNLTVTIKSTTNKGTSGWEGRVEVPGLRPTKLTRKDGATLFPTTGALKTVARNVGKKLNMSVEYVEPQKKAAKKSVKKATSTKAASTKAAAK